MLTSIFRNTLKFPGNLILANKSNTNLSYRRNCVKKNIALLERTICTACCLRRNYEEQETRFNGVYVTLKNVDQTEDEFDVVLVDLLKDYRHRRKRSVLLQIPIEQAHLIRAASKCGFIFHHARDNKAMLSLWMEEGSVSKLPTFANHQVGVAGACFNEENNELLMVQDKGRFSKWWKFPGGLSDLGEDLGDTAVREVREETGVHAEFRSMLLLRQQHNMSFGQSDFYFICRLHPFTRDITPCPQEIHDCRWFPIEKLLTMDDVTPFGKRVCELILHGKNTDFSNIDVAAHVMMNPVFKDKKMVLFHRPVISDE